MKIKSNDKLTEMLRHLAGDGDKLTGVVVSHAKETLYFRVDEAVQIAVAVDVKTGLKAGQSFQIALGDMSIEVDGKPVDLPASVVKTSSSTRGCSAQDKLELKAICG
ncbi:hypothetical protein D3C85_15690 [compost metagenome]